MGSDASSGTASNGATPSRRSIPDMRGWAWVLVLATAALLFIVGTPLTVNIYDAPLLVGFFVTFAHASMSPLAMRSPVPAAGSPALRVGIPIVLSSSTLGAIQA